MSTTSDVFLVTMQATWLLSLFEPISRIQSEDTAQSQGVVPAKKAPRRAPPQAPAGITNLGMAVSDLVGQSGFEIVTEEELTSFCKLVGLGLPFMSHCGRETHRFPNYIATQIRHPNSVVHAVIFSVHCTIRAF